MGSRSSAIRPPGRVRVRTPGIQTRMVSPLAGLHARTELRLRAGAGEVLSGSTTRTRVSQHLDKSIQREAPTKTRKRKNPKRVLGLGVFESYHQSHKDWMVLTKDGAPRCRRLAGAHSLISWIPAHPMRMVGCAKSATRWTSCSIPSGNVIAALGVTIRSRSMLPQQGGLSSRMRPGRRGPRSRRQQHQGINPRPAGRSRCIRFRMWR